MEFACMAGFENGKTEVDVCKQNVEGFQQKVW